MRKIVYPFVIAAALCATAVAEPVKAGSLIDQFTAGPPSKVFEENPDLVILSTVGSPDGRKFEAFPAEFFAALDRLQTQMGDVNLSSANIVEFRIETTSMADLRAAREIIASDGQLSALPITYKVVDGFTVKAARVRVAIAARSPAAAREITRLYGYNHPPHG